MVVYLQITGIHIRHSLAHDRASGEWLFEQIQEIVSYKVENDDSFSLM